MRIFAKRSDPRYVEGKYYYRISARKDDPGYVKNAENYEVYLDGIRLSDCFTADEEQGVAYIHRRNIKTGEILLTGKHEIVEGFLKGHVVVKKVK